MTRAPSPAHFPDQSVRAIPFELARMELSAAMEAGGSADAYILKYDSATDSYLTDTTRTVTVYDVVGDWAAGIGTRFYAIHMHDVDRWEVLYPGCPE